MCYFKTKFLEGEGLDKKISMAVLEVPLGEEEEELSRT
jgi:hypothetical protein